MGILDETQAELVSANERASAILRSQKDRIIDGAMADLSDVLEQPVYRGELDIALVHHFGREAFTDDELTRPYARLFRIIQDARTPGELTPVLILVNPDEDPYSNGPAETVLFMVGDNDLVTESKVSRKEGVKMHAFTDETAGVTTRGLSLILENACIAGDVTTPGRLRPGVVVLPDFVLHYSDTADNGYGVGHGTYEFRNKSESNINLDTWGEPYVKVGWEDIESAILKAHSLHIEGLLSIETLLSAMETTAEWKDHMPILAAKIDAAKVLERQ